MTAKRTPVVVMAPPKKRGRPPKPTIPAGLSELTAETVPISTLEEDPNNARRHSDANIQAIARCLKRFGQQRRILVDADGICRAGNGTLRAARSLGWQQIGIERTSLRGSEAVAYSLADNHLGDPDAGSTWDEPAYAETLRQLQAERFELAALGVDSDYIDQFSRVLEDGSPSTGRSARDEAETKADHIIEIHCSKKDLESFRETLDEWRERSSVTIHIS